MSDYGSPPIGFYVVAVEVLLLAVASARFWREPWWATFGYLNLGFYAIVGVVFVVLLLMEDAR